MATILGITILPPMKAPRPPASPSYRYPTILRSGDLVQSAFWGGVPRVEAFSYTCSHGITAGVWEIVTAPAEADDPDAIVPERYGNLVVTDGNRTYVLRGCKVDSVDGARDESGTAYTIRGFDRRWRWRNKWGGLGGISGRYNQVDPRGKLVPWSIRSPEELAKLCLSAMGESNYLIDLPRGLRKADGADLNRFLRLGENYPASATNPKVDWYRTPPAEALAWIADYFGCVVVYQPITDRVMVVPKGSGLAALPDWPFESQSPGLDDPEKPAGVGVWGAPVRIQARFPLEPVGVEWDGSILPIDQLSYAPDGPPAAAQVSTLTWAGAGATPYPVTVTLTLSGTTVQLGRSDGTGTTASVLGAFRAAGYANPKAAARCAFTVAGNVLTVEAVDTGKPFQLQATPTWADSVGKPADLDTAWAVATPTVASAGGKSWVLSDPPHFASALSTIIEGTERLSRFEAQNQARGKIFQWFRILQKDNVPLDPRDRETALVLPGFGWVQRVSQVVLQPSKVAQVVPSPRVPGGANKGSLLPLGAADVGILPEFYNGRSRDQAPTCTGSVWKQIGTVNYVGSTQDNTGPADRVRVEFGIEADDMGNYLVKFSEPVFRRVFGSTSRALIEYPELTLETACLVTDVESDQPVRYERVMAIPGGTAPVEWTRHDDDLQIGIIGQYGGPDDAKPIKGIPSPGSGTPTPGVIGVLRVNVVSPSHAYPLGVTLAWKKDGVDYTADLTTFGTYPAGTAATRFGEVVTRAAADPNVARDFEVYSNGLQLTFRGQSPFPFSVLAQGVWRPADGPEPGDLAAEYSTVLEAGGAAPGTVGAGAANQPPPAAPGAAPMGPVPFVFAPGDLEHADAAALTYLAAHARKYVVVGQDGRTYPGLMPLQPDGSVQQVTWRGGDGPTTVASLNTEHAVNVLPVAARRRAELLPPNKLAADANKAENALFPPPGTFTK